VAAEAMALLIEDAEMRRDLVAQGRDRVAHFSEDHSRAILLDHLLSVL
jgi:hypothetical protein